jgi:YHS domain-containing protein
LASPLLVRKASSITRLPIRREMMSTKTDPVRKMDVDTNNAKAKSQHKGETYYFCGTECKEKFHKEPAQYAGGKQASSGKQQSPHAR